MKSFLLASASIAAFAGAASAQTVDVPGTPITFGAEAEFGFNDVIEDGFFYSADLLVAFETEITDGFTTTINFTIPVTSGTLGGGLEVDNDFVIEIAAEDLGGLFFGDTAFAAETYWDPGFAMASDDFSEQDSETAIRGESTFFGFDVGLSAVIADPQDDQPGDRPGIGDQYIDQISVGAAGSVGLFALDLAYQEESDMTVVDDDLEVEGFYDTDNGDFTPDELFGVAAGLTFRGADLKFAYSNNLTGETDSYGVLVRAPVGPLALAASYTFEPDFDDNSYRVEAVYETDSYDILAYYEEEIGEYQYGVEVGYTFSEVTQLSAGFIEDENDEDDNGYYAGVRVGIGPAGFIEGSYSEFDESGPFEYREGSTVLVGFTF